MDIDDKDGSMIDLRVDDETKHNGVKYECKHDDDRGGSYLTAMGRFTDTDTRSFTHEQVRSPYWNACVDLKYP